MSPTTVRRILRWGHIVASGVIGTYLYSPLAADPVFATLTHYVVFPLMALSGIAMWQQGRLTRLFRRQH